MILQIKIKISREDYARLREIAARNGLCVADYVAWCVEQAEARESK